MEVEVGLVSVDSGRVLLVDPSYLIHYVPGGEDYGADDDCFCDEAMQDAVWEPVQIHIAGNATAVVLPSGFGDGNYPVVADIRDGKVYSLTIHFIEEE